VSGSQHPVHPTMVRDGLGQNGTRSLRVTRSPITLLEIGALFVLCLIAHGRSLNGVFHYDDLHSIVDNPHIRSLSLIPTLFTDPGTFSGLSFGGMFRPLIMLSYALTYVVFGLTPGWFTAVNLMLHMGVVLLAFFVLRRFSPDRFSAWGAAALVAVHPVNVETVAYISSRSESMCSFFMLAAFLAYVRRPGGSVWPSALSFLLALMCKSVAITLVPLLWLYESWFIRDSWETRWRRLWPFVAVTVGYLWVIRALLSTSVLQSPVRSMGTQLLTQVKALIYYVHLLTLPWGLSVEHQFSLGRFEDLTVWASVIALASALVVLLRAGACRRSRWWLAWGSVVLAPTLIVPLNVLVNEHRLYLVSLAFAALVVRLAALSGVGVRRVGKGILAVMVLLSLQRTAVWADTSELWQDALEKGPHMPRAHLFVGDTHFQAGDNRLALDQYDAALRVNPDHLSAADRLALHNNRGAALLRLGLFDAAAAAYDEALRLEPTYAPSLEALAGIQAISSQEHDTQAAAARRRGLAAMVAGDVESAIKYLKHSLSIVSEQGTWLLLAAAHERLQQWQEARDIYQALSRDANEAGRQIARKRLESLASRAAQGGSR
jgi:protein O-mannosyl-transferase